jgi:hypothetical protein
VLNEFLTSYVLKQSKSKFGLLKIESLPHRRSNQEYKSPFNPFNCKKKKPKIKARSTIKINASTLPQCPYFAKVPKQTCCFYAHAHILVPRLPLKEQMKI